MEDTSKKNDLNSIIFDVESPNIDKTSIKTLNQKRTVQQQNNETIWIIFGIFLIILILLCLILI